MKTTYIFGHKVPDTDSTISSIVYSKYLNDNWIKTKVIKLWELNNETKFVLDLVWEKTPETITNLPEWSNIILTDHNDKSQSIDDIDKLNIIELIDHHNFWNFSTNKPIKARCEPLCSTCSILYKIFKETNYEINKKTATMLISAIISDSLYFRSPTTTKEDINIVEELNKIALIENLEDFAQNIFWAKSDLWDITAKEIIKSDYKEFKVNNYNFWVWVLETTNPSFALNKENEIIKAMEEIKKESNLDFIMFSIVDIFEEKNTTLSWDKNDKIIIEEIFAKKFNWNKADLWRILSRKKQIVPELNNYFNNK